MIVVGDKNYQLNISRLAYSFQGGLDMRYLQECTVDRIKELSGHSKTIANEINNG